MAKETKCVLVGEQGVGKTSMIVTHTTGDFPQATTKTDFDFHLSVVDVGGKTQISLGLWDTTGEGKCDRLRSLSYPKTDVFLICFSLVNRQSFNSIRTKWFPELRRHCPMTPIILVGTKSDLRDDPLKSHMFPYLISYSKGEKLARKIGAVKYLECSSVMNKGLHEIFYEAAMTKQARKSAKHERMCHFL